MKKPFNATATQTFASRQAELEAHAKKIDEVLRTPKKPGVHFTPHGVMRRNGSQYAHDALTQKRVDINKELQDIRQQLAKRQEAEKAKTQVKAL